MLLSDVTEELIFGKTKDVLEEIEHIARTGGPAVSAAVSMLNTRQLALQTMALLRISLKRLVWD
ncbi:hypothetical protein LCGC14_2341880 [marine sediment metagenome]|uniref:Uncharacterized protein n=1 Tax=marine sediment metagenome TaxID=412755 RepID=A0A0F9CCN1_9ZZZZ